MKRITPEEAVRVYEAKNAYALQGQFYTRRYDPDAGCVKRCGCIVGVFGIRLGELDLDNESRPTSLDLEDRAYDEGFTYAYIAGLENGFDFTEPDQNGGVEYDTGFEDGQACFLALLEAGRTYKGPEEMVEQL